MTRKTVKSVCPYCGVGCGIVMEVAGNKIVKVTGDKTHPTNFGRLCTKGSSCHVPVAAAGRADKAYARIPGSKDQGAIPMEEAISRTAQGLRAIIDRDGPDAVSFYVSGQMSLESQYLANKLCKGFIGTNNIESNSRLCMASAASGYKLSIGADGPPGSYQDFEKADLFFVIGANMADCHPILFLRMMDRVKAGARLIVVDPRRNATADKADLFLQVKPGTDLALLNGLLHLLVEAGKIDEAFIASHTEGWEIMPEFLADYSPENVAGITGITEADLRQAAQWIGEAPEWMTCWTMGLNQSTHGTWNTNAICNLHLATGAICRPGSGPLSLTGQPNAMGGREMGYMGPGLPGQRATSSEVDRHFVEDMWGVPRGTLRVEAGAGTVSMFEEMAAGKIKACWIICTNPVASVSNRKTVIAALEAAELVIAQDVYLDTETNRYADIVLPGALWAEAEGVMINSERNLTLMEKAVDPPGEAMADWEIIARVACEMGYAEAFTYDSAAAVFEEIRQFWNPRTGYDSPDSRMIGGQIALETPSAPLQAELAVGYYDYSLRSVAGADVGDFRSNLFANGRYLSDFNLLDVIAAVTWHGLSERWPVRVVGDYVHNFGAATGADTGFGIDLLVGRASQPGDWRFNYGYAQAETDAVLAAFSHDNTNLATNYLQHTLAVDFVPRPHLTLNATYYRYRQKDVVAGLDFLGWQNRLRLNFMVGF